jgi:hypothetical protein
MEMNDLHTVQHHSVARSAEMVELDAVARSFINHLRVDELTTHSPVICEV